MAESRRTAGGWLMEAPVGVGIGRTVTGSRLATPGRAIVLWAIEFNIEISVKALDGSRVMLHGTGAEDVL
jgi:hypothetical protein